MGCWVFRMFAREDLGLMWISKRRRLGFVARLLLGLWFSLVLLKPVAGLRPIREKAGTWGDEVRSLNFYSFFFIVLNIMFIFMLNEKF